MKKHLYLFTLIGLVVPALFFVQCKEEGDQTAPYRCSLTNFSAFSVNDTSDIYCLVTREDGSTVAAKHFPIESVFLQSLEIEVENADASELLDVTVFTNMNAPNWSAYTWRKAPSGAALSRWGLTFGVGGQGVYINTSITGAPALDSMEVPGAIQDFLVYPIGANVSLIGSILAGNTGFLVRARPAGQQDWLAHWQPYMSLEPFTAAIPFGSFKPDYPKHVVTLPSLSDRWTYQIAGVVQEAGNGVFAFLAEKNIFLPGEPVINAVTFESPTELYASKYSVAASDNAGNSYHFLLSPDNLTFPKVDFGVSSSTLTPVGNTFRLNISTSGKFDILIARLFGNDLLQNWTIFGSPEDLIDYTLPVWPVDWPVPGFQGSDFVYPTCEDYQAYTSFQEALMNIKQERFGQARAGWRQHAGF